VPVLTGTLAEVQSAGTVLRLGVRVRVLTSEPDPEPSGSPS
jgi:hypothetical protein